MLNTPATDPADRREPVVIMRSEDGGVEVLAEDRTYLLPHGSLRDLLFYGRQVRLIEGGLEADGAVAWPGPDRHWVNFVIGGIHYLVHRSRLVWVARGEIPADRLCCTGVR